MYHFIQSTKQKHELFHTHSKSFYPQFEQFLQLNNSWPRAKPGCFQVPSFQLFPTLETRTLSVVIEKYGLGLPSHIIPYRIRHVCLREKIKVVSFHFQTWTYFSSRLSDPFADKKIYRNRTSSGRIRLPCDEPFARWHGGLPSPRSGWLHQFFNGGRKLPSCPSHANISCLSDLPTEMVALIYWRKSHQKGRRISERAGAEMGGRLIEAR
jgi:hypothetical protein